MKNEEVEITIKIRQETMDFLTDVKNYENLKSKFKNGRPKVDEEDIVKAAIDHFMCDVRNFYKQLIINDIKNGIGKPYKLRNRLKEILKEKGLKQKDLSELSGMDRASISLILTNRNLPSMDAFLRIWVALDYPSVEDMFYRELS